MGKRKGTCKEKRKGRNKNGVVKKQEKRKLLGMTRVENYFLDHIKMKLGRKFMWGVMENKMGKDDRGY